MPKAALIFIFNHKFEANVKVLTQYYGSRFSNLRFLMPFATEEDPRVFRVFENGYTFGGHIAQASSLYDIPDVTHFIFLGDDLILNPAITESNLVDMIGLEPGEGYIKNLVPIDTIRHRWPHSIRNTRKLDDPGFSYLAEVPGAADALTLFRKMGLEFKSPWPRTSQDWVWMSKTMPNRMKSEWLGNLKRLGRKSSYPLLAGYADLVVIPSERVAAFAHFCGVFSAMNLFAEVAVPTSTALACKHVKTELVLGEHFMDEHAARTHNVRLRGQELWYEAVEEYAQKLDYNWERFIGEFPEDTLYFHPIKLSKWK